jgi:hypothetical protein
MINIAPYFEEYTGHTLYIIAKFINKVFHVVSNFNLDFYIHTTLTNHFLRYTESHYVIYLSKRNSKSLHIFCCMHHIIY